MRTSPECHGEPITFGNVYLVHKMRLKSEKKIKITAPSCIPLVFVCLSEVRIYLLMSSVRAAKSGSWHRLEGLFLSESHFTAEQVRAKCRVDA